MKEIINFGTHILQWDIYKKRNGKDKNVPSVFLRNSIELGDAISILIEKSSIEPSKIIVRSLMESTFSLIYMIEKDEDLRSYAYLIYRLNKEIKFYKQFVKEERNSRDFVAKITKQEPSFKLENYCNPLEIKNVIEAKESLLKEEPFNKVNIEFNRTCNKRKKRNNNPNWYALYDGPNNFEELCSYLSKKILYEFHYRSYSERVHTNNVMNGFVIAGQDDKADILQIRNFKDCKEVFYITVNLLIDVYREFIKMRLPEKQIEFDTWYSNFLSEFEKTDKETKFRYIE